MASLSIEEYQVGWVCALSKELTAARAMLDEEHELCTSQVPHDNNSYVLGRIYSHNVVVACLPAGVYGTVSAGHVANNMLRTFTGIRFGLMVGIGGGIPDCDKGVDIRLGDVVVSQPDGTYGGVVQFDFRKNLGNGVFVRKGDLQAPPTLLLTALANLQSQHHMYGNQIPQTLCAMVERFPRLAKVGYVYPGPEKDLLYCSNIGGCLEGHNCNRCQDGIVQRPPREDHSPEVHYGVIASGNGLMKNAVERDRLAREFGAKCIEMEAAGLMNDFPCIVIRGVCDYGDSRKNDVWQEYAAATAACFTKELLSIVKPAEVTIVKQATEVIEPYEPIAGRIAAKKRALVQYEILTKRQDQQKRRQQARQTGAVPGAAIRSDVEGSPQWFVGKIEDNSITSQQFQRLSDNLRIQPVSWVKTFTEIRGQIALTNALMKINRTQAKITVSFRTGMSRGEEEDLSREYNIVKCFQALTNSKYGLDITLAYPKVPIALATCLMSPLLITRILVSEVLTLWCHSAEGLGHALVLEALDHENLAINRTPKFEAWLRLVEAKIDERGKMGSLLSANQDVRISGMGMENLQMEYAVATLILINTIVDAPEMDLQLRCRIRAQFVACGVKRMLTKWEGFQYDTIDKQVERFRENEAIDHEYLSLLNDDTMVNSVGIGVGDNRFSPQK